MNRCRLTRERWATVLRWATRAENGERIAAGVIALVAFVSGIATILYTGLYVKNLARSMASGPGHAMALGVAEARPHDALGLTRMELISRKAVSSDGPDPSLLENAFWPGIDWPPLRNESVVLPPISITYDRQESWRALRLEGVEEFIFGPRVTVQRAPPTISRGAYARASIAGSWWAHLEECGTQADLRRPELRAEAVHAARDSQSVPSGCWDPVPDVSASIGDCDSSAPGGIRLKCGAHVASETGSDSRPPIAPSAVVPRELGVVTTLCAGMACRSPGGTATQATPEASANIYSALAARLEISAPNQLPTLPAPTSGWVDIGYTSQAPPRWRQTLAVLCDAPRTAIPSSLRAQCDLPAASESGAWGVSFQSRGLEGAFDPTGWHLNVSTPSGINVLVASALQTPLQDFNIDPTWGIQVSTPGGLQIIGTSSGVQVLQHIDLSFGQLFAGITPQGPMSGLQVAGDTVSGHISTLISSGQVQAVGDVTVRAGDFNFTAALTTSDLQLGVAYTIRNGSTVQLSWSNGGGVSVAYMLPSGPTVQLSWSNGFQIALAMSLDLGMQPAAVAPVGGGALGFTAPSAFDTVAPSVHFRWPLPALAPPSIPAAPGLPPASATVVIRFCVDNNGDGACRQLESHPPLQVLVDGQPTTTMGARISVSPGHHTITVPLELIPARLVPLRDLTCDLTIPASTVGFCDLPVRSSGTP